MSLQRRTLLAAGLALPLLAACDRQRKAVDAAQPRPVTEAEIDPKTLPLAVAGGWRTPADRARDAWRHPVESLSFWGVAPGMTVVEFWPGAGWYTDILGPFLTATDGRLYAANLQVTDPTSGEIVASYERKLRAAPKLYRAVEITAFGASSGPVAPAGTADVVLFLRNLHNWMAAGIADKAFRDAFAALKPGGVLGIEEHRAKAGEVQDVLANDGYVQVDYAKRLAADAGFKFDKASEINANLADTRDHPFGVWTLPPVRRSSPRGVPDDPAFDHSKFDAIGESDRMTLRFVKPA